MVARELIIDPIRVTKNKTYEDNIYAIHIKLDVNECEI